MNEIQFQLLLKILKLIARLIVMSTPQVYSQVQGPIVKDIGKEIDKYNSRTATRFDPKSDFNIAWHEGFVACKAHYQIVDCPKVVNDNPPPQPPLC